MHSFTYPFIVTTRTPFLKMAHQTKPEEKSKIIKTSEPIPKEAVCILVYVFGALFFGCLVACFAFHKLTEQHTNDENRNDCLTFIGDLICAFILGACCGLLWPICIIIYLLLWCRVYLIPLFHMVGRMVEYTLPAKC